MLTSYLDHHIELLYLAWSSTDKELKGSDDLAEAELARQLGTQCTLNGSRPEVAGLHE